MAQMSLRPAFVLAVLLSLTCGAIAGRHLLQTGSTYYKATSTVTNLKYATTVSTTLTVNVTTTYQFTDFNVRITGSRATKATDFYGPAYLDHSNGLKVVAQMTCTFTLIHPSTNEWGCHNVDKVSLIDASQPVSTLKTLIDAGMFKNPSNFTFGLKVIGVVMEGPVSTTVTSY
ncbi:unnamed protein product [Closterium sp. Yama58-4]|nr:unnamed protein product [Closterium sp. Yama58-4]